MHGLRLAVQGADGAQRIEHAQAQVVVHRQVAVGRVGVEPRQHVHRMPLPHQVAHEGVVRLQIEDVVLHDPRRHDQQGFGVHFGGLRRVADQLDQAVSQHDLARRDGQVAPDLEARGLGQLLRVGQARCVGEPVHRTLGQVRAPRFHGVLLHDRVGGQPVGRRHHAQPLAGEELRHVDMVRRHARHARGLAPEGFAVAKAGAQHAEWPRRPGRVTKARVVVGTAGGTFAAVTGRPPQRVGTELRGQCRQLHLPPRRQRQVPGPIGPGQRQRHRRQPPSQGCGAGVQQAVQALGRRLRWVGVRCKCGLGVDGHDGDDCRQRAGRRKSDCASASRRIGLMHANCRVTPGAASRSAWVNVR